MLKKRSIFDSKKGLSHVDWAISLSIFLFYLAWFFILVKPHLMPSDNTDTLMDILAEGVHDELFTEIQNVHVKVLGGGDGEYEPIIIPFEKNWTESTISHSAQYFKLDGKRMLFIGNLSDTDEWDIYHPHDALRYGAMPIVIADKDETTFEDFRVGFDEGLPAEIYFDGVKRLWDYSVEVDETAIDDDNSFSNMDIVAKYVRMGNVNHSTYMFAKNSRMVNFIESADGMNHSVVVSFTGYNYTDYYLDASQRGELTYRIRDECTYYDTDFIDLYDSSSGMAIVSDENMTLRLCTNSTDVKIELEFDISDDNRFDIIMHDGDYHEALGYPLDVKVGVTETMDVLDAERALYLKNRDYEYLKQVFGYPDDRDFRVEISSPAVDATYGKEHPDNRDVHARKIRSYILDRDQEEKQVNMTLTVW